MRGAVLAATIVTVPALLSACVIGEVGQESADSAGTTDASGTPVQPTAPQPSGSSSDTPSSPSSESGSGELDVPADLGEVSVAVVDGEEVSTGGSLGSDGDLTDAAWSTSKVPLSIAALRAAEEAGDQGQVSQVTGQMEQAITASDNAAADALWASLGEPAAAARAVQDVLSEAGDSTTVESEKVRSEYSAYGQTRWSVSDQARFASRLTCLPGADSVIDAMGRVAPDQAYGLGQIDGAIFKGGWGPGEDGRYLVRQFGLVPARDGTYVPVAVAAIAPDGSYDSGKTMMNELVDNVREEITSVTGVTGPDEQGEC